MIDWGSDLKETLKIKKGRRSNKNKASQEEIEVFDSQQDPIPDEDNSFSSIKLRKTGRWSDEVPERNIKLKSNVIEQERFSSATTNYSSHSNEDIPIIPDLDDLNDDTFFSNEVMPKISMNRVAAYKELDSDLTKQNALASLEDLDLTILTKCLRSEVELQEYDVVWNWEQLFAEVSATMHEKPPIQRSTNKTNQEVDK